MRKRFIAWNEIERFGPRQRVASCAAVAYLATGRALPTGLMQGSRMTWQDGSTIDIVSVLNRELDRHRAASAASSVD
jgi:hypothetical protein